MRWVAGLATFPLAAAGRPAAGRPSLLVVKGCRGGICFCPALGHTFLPCGFCPLFFARGLLAAVCGGAAGQTTSPEGRIPPAGHCRDSQHFRTAGLHFWRFLTTETSFSCFLAANCSLREECTAKSRGLGSRGRGSRTAPRRRGRPRDMRDVAGRGSATREGANE